MMSAETETQFFLRGEHEPKPEIDSVLLGIKAMVNHARQRCHRNMADFDIVLGPQLYERLQEEFRAREGFREEHITGPFITVLTANGHTKSFKRQE